MGSCARPRETPPLELQCVVKQLLEAVTSVRCSPGHLRSVCRAAQVAGDALAVCANPHRVTPLSLD